MDAMTITVVLITSQIKFISLGEVLGDLGLICHMLVLINNGRHLVSSLNYMGKLGFRIGIGVKVTKFFMDIFVGFMKLLHTN